MSEKSNNVNRDIDFTDEAVVEFDSSSKKCFCKWLQINYTNNFLLRTWSI